MNERQFNRLLLSQLNDLRGIPQTEAELAAYVEARMHKPSEAQVARSLEYLESAAYIVRCEATAADAALWKITAAGMRQILRQVKPGELDPLIHGV